MPGEAIYRHGETTFADYTPSAAIAAGQVVLLGNTAGLTCGVAHLDIPNGTLGALAVGGGVYDVKVADNYAAWTAVYWDDTLNVLTTTSTNMAKFGFTLAASPAANAVVEVLHVPYV